DSARARVTRYGMSERLGHVALENDQRSYLGTNLMTGASVRDYGEATANEIDEEVREIIEKAFQRTVSLLAERREILERSARRLLEKETLDEADLTAIVAGRASPSAGKPSAAPDAPAARRRR